MTTVKVAVTKKTDFQGKQEEFSNVYTYKGVDDSDNAHLQALANAVVAAEKTVHSNLVTFVNVKIWYLGTLTNRMVYSADHGGLGTYAGTGSAIYKECAILLRWPLPRGQHATRSVPRWLRKYLHTVNSHGMDTTGAGTAENRTPPAALLAYANSVRNPLSGVELCAENGDIPTGSVERHPWIQHRQFPRGRKEY